MDQHLDHVDLRMDQQRDHVDARMDQMQAQIELMTRLLTQQPSTSNLNAPAFLSAPGIDSNHIASHSSFSLPASGNVTDQGANSLLLFEKDHADVFFASLETVNGKNSCGAQYGLANICRIINEGPKKTNGIDNYVSLDEMDIKYGKSWPNEIKEGLCCIQAGGRKSCKKPHTDFMNRANEFRQIYALLLTKIPGRLDNLGSEEKKEKAKEQAIQLDKSRGKHDSLSSWWQLHKTYQVQAARLKKMRESVHASLLEQAQRDLLEVAFIAVDVLIIDNPVKSKDADGRMEVLCKKQLNEAQKLYDQFKSFLPAGEGQPTSSRAKKRKSNSGEGKNFLKPLSLFNDPCYLSHIFDSQCL
jgi:hypothetical protein